MKIAVLGTNPLDTSKGMPPSLFTGPADSLGERIQKGFPDAKVVKSLNTIHRALMIDAGSGGGGERTVFVSGNDATAKARVTEILKSWFGWKDVLDLGDITTARGTEAYVLLWVRMYMAFGSPSFNVKVVR